MPTSVDPRRQKTLELTEVAEHEGLLRVTTNGVEGFTYWEGPLNFFHREICLTRVLALQRGLDGDGLCRPVDIDNLLFVAKHPRDLSRMRKWPFTHQVEDMETMLVNPFFFITSEMRTGKSKVVIDAAQYLYQDSQIDRVIVVAPAPVRDVWYDPTLGELAKHLWTGLNATVTEYHAQQRTWVNASKAGTPLYWFTTNYEFLRAKKRLEQLLNICNQRTLLVLDESSFVKNHAAAQTKACLQLRRACGRVVLVNGTPIFHSPLDLFSQGNILSPKILNCYSAAGRGPFISMFKARYAVQKPVRGYGGKALTDAWGNQVMKIESWTNLDDLERRFKPFTVRRLQKDCLDLPPKLDPVTLTATLMPETWKTYKEMRNDLVVWLNASTVSLSTTAAVKAMRLSQITSGFLGGVEGAGINVGLTNDEQYQSDLGIDVDGKIIGEVFSKGEVDRQISRLYNPSEVTEIGREKLDVLLWFIGKRLEEDPNLHLVAWSRHRAEAFIAMEAVRNEFPQFETAVLLGGQKRAERLRALALLKPEISPVGPVFVAGIEGTGSFGLDMTAAHTCVTLSSGYSPGRSAQTLDRVYGPGQTEPIAYYNIVAVGPKNQKTIDHDILEARLSGEDVANRTASAWVKALKGE